MLWWATGILRGTYEPPQRYTEKNPMRSKFITPALAAVIFFANLSPVLADQGSVGGDSRKIVDISLAEQVPQGNTSLADERIEMQTIATIGDDAELPFILFEDVQFDFAGICPKKLCEFSFVAKEGKLTLNSVNIAEKTEYLLYINYGLRRAADQDAFNKTLRAGLMTSPRTLVKSPEGS